MQIKKDLSIVLGTHNRIESLKKLINVSCASANGCDYEIIINDAESTDGTIDWLKEICKKNNRIIPIFGKKEGITKAYNECFENSVGKFIIWLSDDMIPLNGALFNMFRIMINTRENIMGAFQTRNDQGSVFKVPTVGPLFMPTVGCVHSNYFKQNGFWNTDYPYYGQDSEWNARVYRMGGIILPTQEKIDHLNLQDNLKSENLEKYKNDGFFDKYRLFYSRNYGRKSEWKYPAIYFNLQQGYSPEVIERVIRGFNIFYKNIVFMIPEKQELRDPHNCIIFCPKSEATPNRFDLVADISPRGVKILDNSGTQIQSEFLNQIIGGKKMDNWNDFFGGWTVFKTVKIQERFIKMILKYTDKDSSLLEVAAGSGLSSFILKYSGRDVLASDIDFSIVQKLIDLVGGTKLDMFNLERDLKKLCFAKKNGKYFDCIFHQGALEHFEDDDIIKTLKEQGKVAKYVIFDIPNGRRFDKTQEFGNERFLPVRKWKHLIKEAGLELVEYDGRRLNKIFKYFPFDLENKKYINKFFGTSSIFVCRSK